MKIITDQIRPHDPGGRSVEIPFVRRELGGVKNSTIADFGCMNGPTGKNYIGTKKYGFDTSNIISYFDLLDVPNLRGQYNRVDFTTTGFHKENSFDYGICISVVEHIGLNSYGNKVVNGADVVAIENMYATIKSGGSLYITVPASDTYQLPLHWIRSYTPQMIKQWGTNLVGANMNIQLCKYVPPNWCECMEDEFTNIKQYGTGQGIIGVACITIKKNT